MLVLPVAQKSQPKDAQLNTVLGDYRRKINEIIGTPLKEVFIQASEPRNVEAGTVWLDLSDEGDELKFLDLTDTPSSYLDQGGKGIKVKVAEDGLEFYTLVDTDEKVKVGVAGVTDYLNENYFERDVSNHIRIKQNTLLTGVDADKLDGNHAAAFATSGHLHDDRYYTESEIDTLLAAQDEFKELTDTPSAYTGHGEKIVAVKDTEDGLEFIAPSGGGANVKVGVFTRDTSLPAGTQVIEGLTFEPMAIIFLMGKQGQAEMSLGFDDGGVGANQGCIADLHNQAADKWAKIGTYTIEDYMDVTGKEYKGYVSDKDSDSFTVTWGKVLLPTGTITINYLAIG